MLMLEFFDPRTLLACDCMLAAVFTVVFLGMYRAYPQVRGVRLIALNFLLAVPNAALFALRGHVPVFVGVFVANLLTLTTMVVMYEAILQFTGGRNRRWWLWSATVAAMAVVLFYSQFRSDIVPRIVAMALAMAWIRSLTAAALLGGARRSTQKGTMRLFALMLLVLAAENIYRSAMTYRFGSPQDFLARDSVQTPALALSVFYLAATGLGFLILSSNDLVIRTRIEAHRDSLSETFNRRGLEVNLTRELDLLHRWEQLLSIALIDIDHFKRINDEEGHAAGDTAIRDVAATISTRLRGSDLIGRFGGDEFLLILPQTGSPEAAIVADRFMGDVARLNVARDGRPYTLSVGITEAVHGDTTATLLARADRALYQAKSDGRNCRRVLLAEKAETEGAAVA